jgi:hypothetical protein
MDDVSSGFDSLSDSSSDSESSMIVNMHRPWALMSTWPDEDDSLPVAKPAVLPQPLTERHHLIRAGWVGPHSTPDDLPKRAPENPTRAWFAEQIIEEWANCIALKELFPQAPDPVQADSLVMVEEQTEALAESLCDDTLPVVTSVEELKSRVPIFLDYEHWEPVLVLGGKYMSYGQQLVDDYPVLCDVAREEWKSYQASLTGVKASRKASCSAPGTPTEVKRQKIAQTDEQDDGSMHA